jgi:hypothetical protein
MEGGIEMTVYIVIALGGDKRYAPPVYGYASERAASAQVKKLKDTKLYDDIWVMRRTVREEVLK